MAHAPHKTYGRPIKQEQATAALSGRPDL